MHVVNVDRYLYCVTFRGKDMRGFSGKDMRDDWKVKTGVFWLPHLPHLVLRQLVRMLSYR